MRDLQDNCRGIPTRDWQPFFYKNNFYERVDGGKGVKGRNLTGFKKPVNLVYVLFTVMNKK